MPLTLTAVPYGRPAASALRDAIAAAKGDEPLAPVTVVVPSNHVGVAARRLLASGELGPVCGTGSGLAGVAFLTVYRLAELLGAARLAGAGRRPVSTPVIAAAVRRALRDDPGVFAPVAEHEATETALVDAYRELRDLSAGALDALAATSTRARDVVRLHRRARAALAPRWYDEEDLLDAAADAVRDGAAAPHGAIVVHLPQRLGRHATGFLRALGEQAAVHVVAALTGDDGADAEVRDSLARLGLAVDTLALAPPLADAARTRFVTASDADEEVRAAVRAVVDDVRAHGTRLDRIAILHARPEPYARLVHEHLDAAGIPANGAAVIPLTARVAGRTLLDLLALPEGGFRRGDVLAWLSSAPVLDGGAPAPVTAWERLSRAAGVVAGRDQWDERLARHAEGLEASAAIAEADPEVPAWRAERDRTEAQRARALRRFVVALADDLAAAAAAPRRWGEHAAWATALLHRLLGDGTHRDRWPVAAERKAADAVEAALQRLAALDEVEGAVPLEVFTRTLRLELDRDLGRVGRLGEGVLVGSVGMGAGLDLDLVVVLGLAEGSFPAPVREDALLADAEREACGGELPLARQRVEREHRQLLAALAGANRHVLGVPRGDLRRSSERVVSRWALGLATALAGRRLWSEDLLAHQAPWIDHVASFDAGLRRAAVPATEQEHRLRALLAAGHGPAALDALAHDGGVAAGAALAAGRRSSRFTRFDGNLGGLAVPSPAQRPSSPTRLERWASCPHAYFQQYVLGVEEVENPDDQLRISALDRGSLVHEILERFVAEVLARPEGPPPPGVRWSAGDHARIRAIGEEVCDAYEAKGVTGRPLLWRQDRREILADLDRFLDEDDATRAERGTTPVAVEHRFDPVEVPLPGGRTIRLNAIADRIDRARDGGLYVIDYKTGSRAPYDKLSQADPDQKGTRLQLTVYGLGARAELGPPGAAIRAEYLFPTAKGEFKTRGYTLTDEVVSRVTGRIETIVDGIEAGVFPPYSEEGSTRPFVGCAYCDPDGLGVVDLQRAWKRKRDDPALAVFADLADPLDGDGGHDG